MPPETSCLLSVYRNGRLSRAHVERFASELALHHAREPVGYSGNAGLILRNVFLHEGQMILQPPRQVGAATDHSDAGAWSDVASVIVELELLGLTHLANFFLAAWLEQSGAFDALGALRSSIAREALRSMNRPTLARDVDSAVARALRIAGERMKAVRPGSMLITHGLSGSGKTTLATELAGLIGAIVVRTDAEHIRLRRDHSIPLDDSAPARAPEKLIDRLEMLAAQASTAGWPVIVESCFLDRANRQRFRAKAAELGVPFAVLECAAPLSAISERLNRRRGFGSLFHGDDASALAAAERLQAQLERMEPLDEHELACTIRVDTGKRLDQVDHRRLASRILELGTTALTVR